MTSVIARLKQAVLRLFRGEPTTETAKPLYSEEPFVEEVHSIWDYLKIREHTQAYHIISIVGFEEWIPMDEILRRIKEIFGIEYKNERSLYPYIKTLVDCGLMETTNFGGKQRWRRKDLIVRVAQKKKAVEEETDEQKVAIRR
jgi:hypothetical protein